MEHGEDGVNTASVLKDVEVEPRADTECAREVTGVQVQVQSHGAVTLRTVVVVNMLELYNCNLI